MLKTFEFPKSRDSRIYHMCPTLLLAACIEIIRAHSIGRTFVTTHVAVVFTGTGAQPRSVPSSWIGDSRWGPPGWPPRLWENAAGKGMG